MTPELRGLVAGRLDEAAREVFLYGACEALAIAVHDRTGWPLVKLTDAWNVQAGDGSFSPDGMAGRSQAERAVIGVANDGSALHWLVLGPDGRLVDVDGAHDRFRLFVEYDTLAHDAGQEAALGTATRDEAIEEHERKGSRVSLETAASFVDAVLALNDWGEI
jgi:hypothetical protein